jgi:hypothetical protein
MDKILTDVGIYDMDIDPTYNILLALKFKIKKFFDENDKRKLISCVGLLRENFVAHASVISQRGVPILDKIDDHFKDHEFMKAGKDEFEQFHIVGGGLDYATSRINHDFFDQILLDFLIDVLNASLLMFGISKLLDKKIQLINDKSNKHLLVELNNFQEKTLENFISLIAKNTRIIYDNDVMDKIIQEIGIFDKKMDEKMSLINVME